MFQVDRSPGITDYLMGKAELHQIIKKVAGTNLYIMPAGEAVLNPLELLNLQEVKTLFNILPTVFNWVILDTPPLSFAADALPLSTLCHGTKSVVRIGTTTIDSVTRAMQSLCENNVLGISVNGARRGELYSKYTYYHSYYAAENARAEELQAEEKAEASRSSYSGCCTTSAAFLLRKQYSWPLHTQKSAAALLFSGHSPDRTADRPPPD